MTPQDIFNHWNTFKGNWKSHTRMNPRMETIILTHLREWPAEELVQAISNYAKVLQSNDTFWTYKWSLYDFFSRRDKDNRSEYQWPRWTDNEFDWSKYSLDSEDAKTCNFCPNTVGLKYRISNGKDVWFCAECKDKV